MKDLFACLWALGTGMLYLRSLWQVQIFLIVIKVVMITMPQTHRCAALSLSRSCCDCLTNALNLWHWGRVVSELLGNNPLYRTPFGEHLGKHTLKHLIWFSWSVYLKWQLTLDVLLWRYFLEMIISCLLGRPLQASITLMWVNGVDKILPYNIIKYKYNTF